MLQAGEVCALQDIMGTGTNKEGRCGLGEDDIKPQGKGWRSNLKASIDHLHLLRAWKGFVLFSFFSKTW